MVSRLCLALAVMENLLRFIAVETHVFDGFATCRTVDRNKSQAPIARGAIRHVPDLPKVCCMFPIGLARSGWIIDLSLC